MRPIHYIIILLMSSTLMCTKKIAIKVDPIDKRLVLYGFVAAGENFTVKVAQTMRNLDTRDYYQPGATVLLYSNDVLLDTLQFSDSLKHYYTDQVVAEVNRSYTLKVSRPGYPSVEATDIAPVLPVTESLEHRVKSRQGNSGHDMDEVIVSFRDPAQVKNHYMVSMHAANLSYGMVCVFSGDPAIERSNTELLPFDDNDCLDPDAVFLSDKSFDGQLKTVNLASWSWNFEVQTFGYARKWRPYLKRYALSEAAYNYLKYTRALHHRDDLPIYPESTNTRTNVKEGYGLFTIYDLRVDTIY